MYAVIEQGGKQYRVAEGDSLNIELTEIDPAATTLELDRVLFVGNGEDIKIGAPYIAAYCASKHAVLGLVRAAAVEYAGKGITVNAVCPGYVDTPMTEETVRSIAEKTSLSEEEARARLAARSPQGRLVTAQEVAGAICFLLSEEAAGINGSTVDVDGGEMAG